MDDQRQRELLPRRSLRKIRGPTGAQPCDQAEWGARHNTLPHPLRTGPVAQELTALQITAAMAVTSGGRSGDRRRVRAQSACQHPGGCDSGMLCVMFGDRPPPRRPWTSCSTVKRGI